MRIGLHVSIAGGLCRSLERAEELGCTAMQIFSGNPRGWVTPKIKASEVKEFRRQRKLYDLNPIIIHAPYLINLSTPDDILYAKSIDAYKKDLLVSDSLGAEYYVIHLGSHSGSGEDNGIRRFSAALQSVLSEVDPSLIVLLENTAGAGAGIGYSFEHIKRILDDSDGWGRVGLCVDTAHMFEAGYDIRNRAGYEETMRQLDREIGLKEVKVIHFNDSLTDLSSRVDRHQHIGKGRIGYTALKRFVRDERFDKAAFILETPKDSDRDDRINLAKVKRMQK